METPETTVENSEDIQKSIERGLLDQILQYLRKNRERTVKRVDNAIPLPWWAEFFDDALIRAIVNAALAVIESMIQEDMNMQPEGTDE